MFGFEFLNHLNNLNYGAEQHLGRLKVLSHERGNVVNGAGEGVMWVKWVHTYIHTHTSGLLSVVCSSLCVCLEVQFINRVSPILVRVLPEWSKNCHQFLSWSLSFLSYISPCFYLFLSVFSSSSVSLSPLLSFFLHLSFRSFASPSFQRLFFQGHKDYSSLRARIVWQLPDRSNRSVFISKEIS